MLTITEITEKRYSTIYKGFYGNRYFEIDINNDQVIAMEYELIIGQFEENEIEQLANDILDRKY